MSGPSPEAGTEECFVCLAAPAVTVEKSASPPLCYSSCDACEPRYVAQGDTILIRVVPLHLSD